MTSLVFIICSLRFSALFLRAAVVIFFPELSRVFHPWPPFHRNVEASPSSAGWALPSTTSEPCNDSTVTAEFGDKKKIPKP